MAVKCLIDVRAGVKWGRVTSKARGKCYSSSSNSVSLVSSCIDFFLGFVYLFLRGLPTFS